MNPKSHVMSDKTDTLLGPILCQINPVQMLKFCFSATYFNITTNLKYPYHSNHNYVENKLFQILLELNGARISQPV